MIVTLIPKLMDESIMEELEGLGVIKRLLPKSLQNPHQNEVSEETNRVVTCYATGREYGGHKLIHVTINQSHLTRLTSHPGHEEFLLLGSQEATPLILVVSKHQHAILEAKFKDGSVVAEDFICLECIMNDARLSFFTMHAGYPHAEVCLKTSKKPPSFFVTESADLPEVFLELGQNQILITNVE